MLSAYFDTSALMKLLQPEAGSDVAATLWDGSAHLHVNRLGRVEVLAGIAAAARDDRLTRAQTLRARAAWERRWERMRPVELTEDVGEVAGTLAADHSLTGADAVHLASALAVATDDLVMATWDCRLHRAAAAAGLKVAPATLP